MDFAELFENDNGEVWLNEVYVPETVEDALAMSIAKWEFIHGQLEQDAEVYETGGRKTCGLCLMFNNHTMEGQCLGCPVYEATGFRWCDHTPIDQLDFNRPTVEMAKQEIAFLKSLQGGQHANQDIS